MAEIAKVLRVSAATIHGVLLTLYRSAGLTGGMDWNLEEMMPEERELCNAICQFANSGNRDEFLVRVAQILGRRYPPLTSESIPPNDYWRLPDNPYIPLALRK
jgi:hypothetical protein